MSNSGSKPRNSRSTSISIIESPKENVCSKLFKSIKNIIDTLTSKTQKYPKYEKYMRELREYEKELVNLNCPIPEIKQPKRKSFIKETTRNINSDCDKILRKLRKKTIAHCIWYKVIAQLGIFLQGWMLYYSRNPHQFNTRASIPFHDIIAFSGVIKPPAKIIEHTEKVMRKQGMHKVDRFVSKPLKMILGFYKKTVNKTNKEMKDEDATELFNTINSDPDIQNAFPETHFHLNLSYCRITHDTAETCNEDVECVWVKNKTSGYCRRSNTRGIRGSKAVFRDIRTRRTSPTHSYNLRQTSARSKKTKKHQELRKRIVKKGTAKRGSAKRGSASNKSKTQTTRRSDKTKRS